MESGRNNLPVYLLEAARIVRETDAKYDNPLYPLNWSRMVREFLQQHPDSAIRIAIGSFGTGIGMGAFLSLGVNPGFIILTSGLGLGFGQMAVEIRRWSISS